MKKYLIKLDYIVNEEPAFEAECTRYVFNPIGAPGFLLLEDDTTGRRTLIHIQKILKTTITEINEDTTPAKVTGSGTMVLKTPMQITKRVTELDNEIGIGDQIAVGHYTATCQQITDRGALFFMDQYDDEARAMNEDGSNVGGYDESDLRRYLQSEEALKDFPEHIREHLVRFENGDLLRIPTVCELFGPEECEDWCEDDGAEQLPLMKIRKNRVAYRKNSIEWGWLQNKRRNSAALFAHVDGTGNADSDGASDVSGVRRAFLIK